MHRQRPAVSDVSVIRAHPTQRIESVEARLPGNRRNHRGERTVGFGVEAIYVGRDARRHFPLERHPLRVGHAGDAVDHVVLPVLAEVNPGLVPCRGKAVHESRSLQTHQRGQRLGAAQLFGLAAHARRYLSQRSDRRFPFVSICHGNRWQRRGVGCFEILEKVDFIRNNDAPAGIGERLGDRREAVGGIAKLRQGLQVVAAPAERADHAKRPLALELTVGVHEGHDFCGETGLGISADPIVGLRSGMQGRELRLPLQQHFAAVRAAVVVNLVPSTARIWHFGRAVANPAPAVFRAGTRPQRSQSQRQSLVFHGQRKREPEAVGPFDMARVIHTAQDGFGGLCTVDRNHRIQRNRQMPVRHPAHEASELRRRSGLLVIPHPKAAIGVPLHLVIGRLGGGRIHLIQIKIAHVVQHLRISSLIPRPHIVCVVVGGDIDALLGDARNRELGQRNQGQRN